MLPLLSARWYNSYPKPVSKQNNLDISIFRQGLRLLEADHILLVDTLVAAMKQNGIVFRDSNFNLRSTTNKAIVFIAINSIISKYSTKYG